MRRPIKLFKECPKDGKVVIRPKMNTKDLIIAVLIILVCIFSFVPAVNNVRVVMRDKSNSKISLNMRRFVLFWSVFGVFAILFVLCTLVYSILARYGFLPNWALDAKS